MDEKYQTDICRTEKSILTVCSGCRTLDPSVNIFLCLEWKSLRWIPCVRTSTGLGMQDRNLAPGRGP